MRVIRHPLFVLAYTAGTVYWWASHPPSGGWTQAFTADAYPWPAWTSLASLMALWIESSVGIAQYYAARRDAVQAAREAELMRAVAVQSDAIAGMLQAVKAWTDRQEGKERDAR
ncbi:MAG: hypothetical protein ACYCU7_19210, partial [Acidimicrobiales bacterium]